MVGAGLKARHYGATQQRKGCAHQQRRAEEQSEVHDGQERLVAHERAELERGHIVVEPGAEEGEQSDGALAQGERAQRPRRRAAIRQAASKEAAEAEPGHEGRHDERDRIDVLAGEDPENPLPDHLIDEGGEARQEGERAGRGVGSLPDRSALQATARLTRRDRGALEPGALAPAAHR